MTRPRDHYPLPIVPEHLSGMTIERLPLDTPVYVKLGGDEIYDDPTFFVSEDRHLMMSKSYDITYDDQHPTNPRGCIGIMRVAIINPATGRIEDKLIADLRLLNDAPLTDLANRAPDMTDQETYMSYASMLENSVTFDGFVASDSEPPITDTVPQGLYYGATELHVALEFLEKCSNMKLKKYIRTQQKFDKIFSTKLSDQTQSKKKKKQKSDDKKQ